MAGRLLMHRYDIQGLIVTGAFIPVIPVKRLFAGRYSQGIDASIQRLTDRLVYLTLFLCNAHLRV